MLSKTTRIFLTTLFSFLLFSTYAQDAGSDCVDAQVICDDGGIAFNPSGGGNDDFADPDNDNGCLASGEHQSAWYYFEFQPGMPANSIIEFDIIPNAGSGEDYDFAIYGPDVECDNLGSPIRCSYAGSGCAFCPNTGLGNGATDDADQNGDGYVQGITVQPGQGFYLIVDNFQSSSQGFDLQWNGSAATFLNCDATPGCELEVSIPTENIDVCIGGTASLSSVIMGQMGGVSYSWTIVDGNASLSNPNGSSTDVTLGSNFQGTVTVQLEVTDSECTRTATATINTLPAPSPVAEPTAFCSGGSTTIGPQGNYSSYSWSTGASSPTITVSNSGSYSVTVTDNNGCEGTATFDVTENPPIVPMIEGNPTLCDGNFPVLFTQMEPGMLYQWSNGETQVANITVYTAGVYQLTVSDALGCEGVAEFQVVYIPTPAAEIEGPDIICDGASATLDIIGNFQDYTWTGADNSTYTGPSIEASTPGTYTVTVTDEDGCLRFGNFDLTAIDAPSPFIDGDLNICPGQTTTLSTQTSFETVTWSTNDQTYQTEVVLPGDISVTVTDFNGCEGSATVTVTEQPTDVEVEGITSFCSGSEVTLTAISSANDILWSTGETTNAITVDSGGIYNVVATNQYGCTATQEITVVENDFATVDIQGNSTFCTGTATTLSAPEGFATYVWSTGETTNTITANTSGTITLDVIDNNGCSGSASIEIEEITELQPEVSGLFSFCVGESTEITVEGNYDSYDWSTGETDATISVEVPGAVSVAVTDEFGCSGVAVVDVTETPLPDFSIDGTLSFCSNDSTTLSVSDQYIAYQWQDASTQNSTVATVPGTYSVTVTDQNNCQNTQTVTVEEFNLPTPAIDGELGFCPDLSTTLVNNDNYSSVSWSNGDVTPSTEVSTPGNYSLTVTDGNGCIGSTSVDVIEYATNIPTIEGTLTVCPEESTTLSVIENFVNYTWSNNDTGNTITIEDPIQYTVTVEDNNGCLTENHVTVDNHIVTAPAINGTADICVNETSTLTATTGYATYMWSTGEDTEAITVQTGNEYTLTAIDTNSCSSQASFLVTTHELPEPNIDGSLSYCIGGSTTLSTPDIYQEYLWSDGSTSTSIQVNQVGAISLQVIDEWQCIGNIEVDITEDTELSPIVSGPLEYCENASTTLDVGSAYATYQWSTNEVTSTIEVSQPGDYAVTVIDADGCIGDTIVTVVQNPLPIPAISGTLEFCSGLETTIQVTENFQEYVWSNSETSASLTVNQAGNYAVTVTNQFNCQQTTNVDVVERPLPDFEITGTFFFCENDQTTILVDDTFSSYDWGAGNNQAALMVDQAGEYEVTVENEFGCFNNESVLVQQIDLPLAVAGTDMILDCETREVQIGSSQSSQGNEFEFSWAGDNFPMEQVNMQMPTIDAAGTYTLIVTDTVHNCISAPSQLTITDLAYEPAVAVSVSGIIDCITETVQLSADQSEVGNGILYNWSSLETGDITNPTNEIVLDVAEPGVYYIQVYDENTHCSSTDSIIVESNVDLPFVNAGLPAHLDCNITSITLDGSASDIGNNYIYQWTALEGSIDNGATTTTPAISTPGTYQLVVTNTDNNCDNDDIVIVTQDITPPTVDAGSDQQLDCHTEIVALNGTANAQGQPIIYNWEFLGGSSNLPNEAQINVEQAGTYLLTATNTTNGCSDDDTVIVILDDSFPTAMTAVTSGVTCFGDTNGSLTIDFVENGALPLLYSINGSDFTSNTVYSSLAGGDYEVIVQDANGCEFEASFNVDEGNSLLVDLGPDQFINLGESANVETLINIDQSEIANIIWNSADSINCETPNCLEFLTNPQQTVSFSVGITDENGCTQWDELTIFVNKDREIYVPNAFSPNGDGNNDFLTIFSSDQVAKVHSFNIFNRWGESVFSLFDFPTNSDAFGWDGTHRGQPLNSAVFVWYAEVEFIDGETKMFSGDVTLIK